MISFTASLNGQIARADHAATPAFNFVQLLPDQTIIQQRPFGRLAGEPVRKRAVETGNLED